MKKLLQFFVLLITTDFFICNGMNNSTNNEDDRILIRKLIDACGEKQDIHEVKRLLELKANANCRIGPITLELPTPLFIACFPKGIINSEIIKLLLEHNANPNNSGNIRSPLVRVRSSHDIQIQTPLMGICAHGDARSAIKMLLDKGADPFITTDCVKNTALHLCYHVPTAQELIKCIKNLLDMNDTKKVTYLCEIDSKFRQQAKNLLFPLKRIGIKIPKYLIFKILLDSWISAHSDDYRCILWSCVDKNKFLGDFVNVKNAHGQTPLDKAKNFYEKLTNFYEKFEHIRINEGYDSLDHFLEQDNRNIIIMNQDD